MSVTKRVWIENDPAYQDFQKARQEEITTYLDRFSERLSLRKFCSIDGKRRLDVTWKMAVSEAANELAADRVIDNDSMLFTSRSPRDAVRKLALEKHVGLFEKYGLKPPKRCPKCNEKMRTCLAERGPNTGRHFWGCSGHPACRFTEDCSDEHDKRQWQYRNSLRRAKDLRCKPSTSRHEPPTSGPD
jgi:hypothetical protein